MAQAAPIDDYTDIRKQAMYLPAAWHMAISLQHRIPAQTEAWMPARTGCLPKGPTRRIWPVLLLLFV